MDKLTWLETIEAEKQEKLRAKKQARLQENQRQKRLLYIPVVFEYAALLGVIIFMYFLVYSSGFVTWVSQEKTQLYCWREVKAKNITPVFTCEKILPRTWAH